ncbi:hypothetical protein ACK8P5_26545 (plasmid) [Paenibacillus sp. EC2-1]|uniref:hypothetical protein n=1 Tax=Paenibacillus sp. EC2-1 TaxID=3388665 RepID=UPI003BEF3795
MKKLTAQEVNILISAYQEDNSKDAAAQLLRCFDGYFQKFINVLRNHKFNMNDGTQRSFAALYMHHPEIRNNVHLFKKSPYMQRQLRTTVIWIAERYAQCSREELINEMHVVFLSMAKNHNWKAPFQKYIARWFPVEFSRSIKTWSPDPRIVSIVPFDESHYEPQYEMEIDIEDDMDHAYRIRSTEDTMFDENWVNGLDCGEVFSHLTTYERRIIKWYYEQKALSRDDLSPEDYNHLKATLRMTETDIASRLGCSRKTVNVKRNEAKEKVREIAQRLRLIKG